MNPHRTPGEVLPDGPEPLKIGPALACPACGAEALDEYRESVGADGELTRTATGRHEKSSLAQPRACTLRARVRVGWLSRCSTLGEHLHEHCTVCGLEWLTAFAEGA